MLEHKHATSYGVYVVGRASPPCDCEELLFCLPGRGRPGYGGIGRMLAASRSFLFLFLSSACLLAQAADGVDWTQCRPKVSGANVHFSLPDRPSFGRIEVKPLGAKLARHLVLKMTPDGVEIDARGAFAAGAKEVVIFSEAESAKPYQDRDTECRVRLASVGVVRDRPRVAVSCGGLSGGVPFSVGNRDAEPYHVIPNLHWYSTAQITPGDADVVYVRASICNPGDGKVLFAGAEVRPYAENARGQGVPACGQGVPACGQGVPACGQGVPALSAKKNSSPSGRAGTPCPQVAPLLLFHATFDGTLVAKVAHGAAEPVETNGLTFVAGRHGRALFFSEEAKSRLAYRSAGNVDPTRGTFSCWVKRDWREKNRLGFRDGSPYHAHFRTLFSLAPEKGPYVPGDGSVKFWWRTDTFRWDRGDAAETCRTFAERLTPYRTNTWEFLTCTWSERNCSVYLNGIPVGGLGDSATPLQTALIPKLVYADESFPTLKKMLVGYGVGPRDCPLDGAVDDLRVWDAPMTDDEVRALAAAEGVDISACMSVWDAPWRDPKTPPPPNAALAAHPAAVPGVLENLELVCDVSPAEIAKSGDASRFRAAGAWRTGTCDGLAYLEAGPKKTDRWALRFKLDASVPLWCFEVTYPDDRARTCDFIVQNAVFPFGDYGLNAGVETGLEHPVSGKNATKRFLYFRRPVAGARMGEFAFIAMTGGEDEPAAVSRIRVYAVRDGRLPATAVDEPKPVNGRRRHFALWFEDPAIMHDFGTEGEKGERDPKLLIDRIAAYMKFTGHDLFVYPGVWYMGPIGDRYMPRNHPTHYLREVCRRFDRDGLGFVASINQQRFLDISVPLTRAGLSDGSLHATPISVHATGLPNWGGWHHTPTYYNIAHPKVQEILLREVAGLCAECRDHPSFRGVALDDFNAICVTWWGNIDAGYNDYCIEAFEKATGVKVPVDRTKPLRGRDYAKWLKANAYRQWVDWRCDVVTDLYRRAADVVRASRPDLMLYVAAAPAWLSGSVRRTDLAEPDATDRMLKEAGIDGAKLGKIHNLAFGPMSMPAFWRDELRNYKPVLPNGRELVRDLDETPGHYASARLTSYPFAQFHDSYYESPVGAANRVGRRAGDGRLRGGWLNETNWRVTSMAASGREVLRPYAKALKYGDLFMFAKGGFLMGTLGDEPVLAPFMQAFRTLPAVRFEDLPGVGTEAVRVRTATVDGVQWFYAVNTGFEKATLALPLPEGATDAITGQPAPTALTLDAYEIRVFKRGTCKTSLLRGRGGPHRVKKERTPPF